MSWALANSTLGRKSLRWDGVDVVSFNSNTYPFPACCGAEIVTGWIFNDIPRLTSRQVNAGAVLIANHLKPYASHWEAQLYKKALFIYFAKQPNEDKFPGARFIKAFLSMEEFSIVSSHLNPVHGGSINMLVRFHPSPLTNKYVKGFL